MLQWAYTLFWLRPPFSSCLSDISIPSSVLYITLQVWDLYDFVEQKCK